MLGAISGKFAEKCTRERAGEAWDNALLYAFKKEVLSAQACDIGRSTGYQGRAWGARTRTGADARTRTHTLLTNAQQTLYKLSTNERKREHCRAAEPR